MIFTPAERELLLTTIIDHTFDCEESRKNLVDDLETELGDDEQTAQTIKDDIAQYTQRLGALDDLLIRVTQEDITGSVDVSRPDLDTIIMALNFYANIHPRGSDVAGTLFAMENKREVLNEQRVVVPEPEGNRDGDGSVHQHAESLQG